MTSLIDPDCRAGKHQSCFRGPCECTCHEQYVGWACQHGNHAGCDSRREAKRWCTCPCHEQALERPDPVHPRAGSGLPSDDDEAES